MRVLTILSLLASSATLLGLGSNSPIALATASVVPLPTTPTSRTTSVDIVLHQVLGATIAATDEERGRGVGVQSNSFGSSYPRSTVPGSTSPSTILKGRTHVICGRAGAADEKQQTLFAGGVKCDAKSLTEGLAIMRSYGSIAAGAGNAGAPNSVSSGLFFIDCSAFNAATTGHGNEEEELEGLMKVLMTRQNTVILPTSSCPAAAEFLIQIVEGGSINALGGGGGGLIPRLLSAVYTLDEESEAKLLGLLKRTYSSSASASSFSSLSSAYLYFRRPAALTGDADKNPRENSFPLALNELPTTALTNTYIAIHNQQQQQNKNKDSVSERGGKKKKRQQTGDVSSSAAPPTNAKSLPTGPLLVTSYDILGTVPSLTSSSSQQALGVAVVGAALHRIASAMPSQFSSDSAAVASTTSAAVYGLIGHTKGLNNLYASIAGEDGVLSSSSSSSFNAVNFAVVIDDDTIGGTEEEEQATDTSDNNNIPEFTLDTFIGGNSLANSQQLLELETFIDRLIAAGVSNGLTFKQRGPAVKGEGSSASGVKSQSGATLRSISAKLQVPAVSISMKSSSTSGNTARVSILAKLAGSISQAAVAAAESSPTASSSLYKVEGSPSEILLRQLLDASWRSDRSTVTASNLLPLLSSTVTLADNEQRKLLFPFEKVIDELLTVTIPAAARRGTPVTASKPLHVATNTTTAVVVFTTPSSSASASSLSLKRAGMRLDGPLVVSVEAHVIPDAANEVIVTACIMASLVLFALFMFGPQGAKKLLS